jgi:bile acid:Na+ symporter, BASS family
MEDFFAVLLRIVTPIFAIGSMALVGLANSPRALVAPLRNRWLVAGALVASFVLVPLLAWGVTRLLSLDEPFETGLMLVAVASGAPVVVMFVQTARGNLALTGAMIVLLLVGTIIYMPLVLPLVVAADVDVDAVTIAITLGWTMVVPLIIGVAARAWSRKWAQRVVPILRPVTMILLALSVLSTVLADPSGIREIFGEGAILAGLLVISAAFAFGFLLGGRDPEARTVLGFSTGQRNIAAAMVVATQDFADDRDVVAMVVVTSLVAMAILFPIAFALRRRVPGGEGGKSRSARGV